VPVLYHRPGAENLPADLQAAPLHAVLRSGQLHGNGETFTL